MGKRQNFHDGDHWSVARDESFRALVRKTSARRVEAITPGHARYLDAITGRSVVVCVGPWGTGKTFMAAAKAVELLKAGAVNRIVLSRPLQECGEPMGFMPGDLYEKTVDMMMPLIESLEEFLAPGEFDELRAEEKVVIVPLEKMRGRNMKDSFVVLDEAQNATKRQIDMFLSRYASGKMVLCGDYTQSDLPYKGVNSLYETVQRLRSEPNDEVGLVEMTEEDIVRSGLARYFHRVLSKPFTPAAAPRAKGVPCPGCGKTFWYDPAIEDEDRLLRCPHCNEYVELFDGREYDPAVVVPRKDEVPLAVLGGRSRPVAA